MDTDSVSFKEFDDYLRDLERINVLTLAYRPTLLWLRRALTDFPVVCYYLLQRKCHFNDLGVNYFDQLNHEKLTRYFVKRLTRLGHKVTLEPCSAAA